MSVSLALVTMLLGCPAILRSWSNQTNPGVEQGQIRCVGGYLWRVKSPPPAASPASERKASCHPAHTYMHWIIGGSVQNKNILQTVIGLWLHGICLQALWIGAPTIIINNSNSLGLNAAFVVWFRMIAVSQQLLLWGNYVATAIVTWLLTSSDFYLDFGMCCKHLLVLLLPMPTDSEFESPLGTAAAAAAVCTQLFW